MKNLFLMLCIATLGGACTDECQQILTQRVLTPVQISQSQLKMGVANQGPEDLKNPGKLYYYKGYLLINETKKGIHIINNTDPSKPSAIAFLKIPGVIDMAIKDDVLYADSYTDLLSFDVSDPKNIKELSRLSGVFSYGLVDGISWYYDPSTETITDYEYKVMTTKVKTACGENNNVWPMYRDLAFNTDMKNSQASGSAGETSTGMGGSMARFAVYDNYLYAATQSDLLVFALKEKQQPRQVSMINLGWGIETIFPYRDKLFIGSNTGMYIFDNTHPSKPERLATFQHVRACDPVVVENNKAYVTLRDGWCGLAPNRLDVLDISTLTSPVLIKSYDMENPHGLSIKESKLMVCEGKFGLKSFDAKDVYDIKLQQHIKDIDAYDVVQLDTRVLLMIGKDGLFQYDNSDPKNMKLLSKIEVKK
jgi:hypothetical protein